MRDEQSVDGRFAKKWEKKALEKYGVEESERGGCRGGGDEAEWIVKRADYRRMKEGGVRGKKHVGETCWSRLVSLEQGLPQACGAVFVRLITERQNAHSGPKMLLLISVMS